MCAALPFLSPLVVVLKCHVKPKAGKILNDLLRLTVCLLYSVVAKAPAELCLLSAHKVEQIGDSNFPFQPMLVFHCLCLTIVPHTLELEFLFSLFCSILSSV